MAGQSGDLIPVGVTRFSASFQNGPGAHPASYKMGTGSFSRGLKRPERGVEHPPSSSAEVKERVELCLYSRSGTSRPVLGWPLPSHVLLFLFITFIQGDCGYIPSTNHVYRMCNVAAILWLQYTVHVKLFPIINTSCCCTSTFWHCSCAVPSCRSF